jgi:uncharacterized membrane protein
VDVLQIVLRIVHIGAAIVWVGSSVFLHFFVEPTMRALGPPGGAFMKHMAEKRKVPVVVSLASVLTVATGLVLYWRVSDGFNTDWIGSDIGLAFTVGGISAILALVLGVGFVRPKVLRMGVLGAEMGSGQPSQGQIQEMGAVQRSVHTLSLLTLGLLGIAVISMAAARYL